MNQENGNRGVEKLLGLGSNRVVLKPILANLVLQKLVVAIPLQTAEIRILFRITEKGMKLKPLVDEYIKAYDILK